MKFLAKIFKNTTFFFVLGILLLIAIILLIGYLRQWPLALQLLGVGLVIALGIILSMYRRLRAIKGAASIEQSIKSRGITGKGGLGPAGQDEIDQLEHQLAAAIDTLKKSKVAKGVSGRSALYALPWYMYIGPPGAGKTTAIENSGLEFPYGTQRIRGVGGTRNCDWFFSNSAIFLDTAGRYTTQDEDREEWSAFLDMLKKNRRKRPVNGVIIGVSITDIMTDDMGAVEQQAKTIRNRIDELIDRLGVQFPVYLTFTKCDLIRGFVEFHEDLGRSKREQIWGCTFTRAQQQNPDISGVFQEEFQQLYDALISARLARLNSPMNRETRERVYTFPLEFLSLREQLDIFLSTLFQPNPYRDNPRFRGFYFTSGTQEGVPIDRVIQSIVQQFDLQPEVEQRFNPEVETKSYFIKDVFTDIIIPDQHMVNRTSQAIRRYGMLKLGAFGAAILLVALVFIGSLTTLMSFRRDARHFLQVAQNLQHIQWQDEDFSQNFYTLANFQAELQQVNKSALLRFGLYKGNQLVEPAKLVFYTKLKPFVDTYLYQGLLRDELQNYASGHSDNPRSTAYDELRAYLLMGEPLNRLQTSSVELSFLEENATALVDSLLEKRFNFAYQSQQNDTLDALRGTVENQVRFFVNIMGQGLHRNDAEEYITGFQTDTLLVRRTRQRLGAPNIRDVYARIKREAILSTEPQTLGDIIGEQNLEYFSQNTEVPGFFTKQGWEQYTSKKIEEVSKTPDQNDWVLAIASNKLPEELRDPQVMQQELLSLYFDDYINAWRRFIQAVDYRSFSDFSTAVRAMKLFGDQEDSPVRSIVQTVADQTQFENAVDRGARGLVERLGMEGRRHVVDQAFQPLHSLTNTEGEGLAAILNQYQSVSIALDGLQKEAPATTAEYAAGVIQQRSGELPDAVQAIQNQVRSLDVRTQESLFVTPVVLSWRVVLGRTAGYLNDVWRQQVYADFSKALAPHYPFNKTSTSEVPVGDLVDFFQGNSGILWNYIQTNLRPFIKDNSYNANTWGGYGLQLSRRTRTALQKASEITRGLNLNGQSTLSLTFSILPDLPTPGGILDQVTLSIDGKTLAYRMGRPQWMEFTWPGYSNDVGTYLEVRAKQGSFDPKYYDSQWGLFRLLDAAQIEETSASHYMLHWTFAAPNGQSVRVNYRLRAASIDNPFGKNGFFQISLPQNLF